MTLYAVGGETIYPDDFVNLAIDSTAYFLNLTAPPQVISTSYGTDEDSITPRLAVYVASLSLGLVTLTQPTPSNLCNMLAQLGARGVSALFASGDGGVSGLHYNETCTAFRPTFPSTCP